ncbi:MAG: hypothetical protein M3313_07240 [Actinomycetota bacterium]|nr:hypothetical protein [Actinomycetota bacterium]
MRNSTARPTRGGEPSRGTAVVVAAAAALATVELGRRAPALSGTTWTRINHRGKPVSLVAGPVAALTASVVAAAALPARMRTPALLVGITSGAVGLYDDIVGARPGQSRDKGFRGHLHALRSGRVSTGALKVVGIVGAAMAAAGSVSTGPADRLVAAGVMAGTANLVNLLDLRPGRAAKATALGAAATLGGPAAGASAAVLGTSLGVLPADLAEVVMLGDAGANALGALLGYRLTAGSGPLRRAGMLAVLVALTAAAEVLSFTQVIETTPGLRDLDSWGRLTVGGPSSPPMS